VNDLGKIMVVVNPHSANGAAGRQWPSIKRILEERLGTFESRLTRGSGHATEIVRDSLSKGFDTILSVGGDGTNNEIVNGFFDGDEPVRPEACFGCISRGTGSDLIKTLKIPKETQGAIEVLLTGRRHPIDVGRMSFLDHKDRRTTRYFVNIASFGMGGAVDEKVNTTTKRFGGFISFLWATLFTLVRYENQTVTLSADEAGPRELRIVDVAVANGQYFGGGMHVAPSAVMDDGLFDVVVLGDFTKWEAVRDGMKIYRGTHIRHPKVEWFRARRLEARSSERVLLDVDGEQPGKLPASFEVVAGALRVFVPQAFPAGGGKAA